MKTFSKFYVLIAAFSAVVDIPSWGHELESLVAQVDNEEDEYLDGPMTIAVSLTLPFKRAGYWYLSVNSEGKAAVTISTEKEDAIVRFDVTPGELLKLRKALKSQRFFELRDTYGDSQADDPLGPSLQIAITIGKRTKAVAILKMTDEEMAEVKQDICRILRIELITRNWFDDLRAVDLRAYSKKFLRENEMPAD